MKKLQGLLLIYALFYCTINAQTNNWGQKIYGGFTHGMSESEVKHEFRKNKDQYVNINFGGGFVLRAWTQNFRYVRGRLASVIFIPKGNFGLLNHDNTKNCIKRIVSTLLENNWKVKYKDKYWDTPIFYDQGNRYCILLEDEDEQRVVHIWPFKVQSDYIVQMLFITKKQFLEGERSLNKIDEEATKDLDI